MSIDNISFLSPPMSKPLQYEYDKDSDMNDGDNYNDNDNGYTDSEQTRYMDEDNEEDENNIIPWKKLLRKTNSRLNLIT